METRCIAYVCNVEICGQPAEYLLDEEGGGMVCEAHIPQVLSVEQAVARKLGVEELRQWASVYRHDGIREFEPIIKYLDGLR